jgi:TonB family protein
MPARCRLHALVTAGAAFVAIVACPRRAHAEPNPEPATTAAASATPNAPTPVTPPKLEHDPGVAYPKAALDRGFYETVGVNLVLEIDAAGRVTRSSLEQPAYEEFDAVALAAASALRFVPASRAGAPAAARIRFRYVFTPPPAVFSGTVVDQQSGLPLAGVRVVVASDAGRNVELVSDEHGEFRSDELPPGRATARVQDDRYEPQAASVSIIPGSDTVMRVALVRRGSQSSTPPGAPSEATLEVVVHGEKLAPAVTTLTREEVRQMPGAFGDPFRAIEALPGVTPIGSGVPFFYVRGAPPGNVGYFLDGIRVPFLYHVAIGPSVIHPGLVERVDLHSGGYPSRYGRFAGGLVAAETTEPRADLHGEANLRLFDAGALAEGGFAGGRGTLLLGGRYSYTATLLSLLVPDLVVDYRDYQARATYELTNDDRVGVFAFGSYDLLGQEQRNGTNVLFGSEFYRVDLRHEHDLPHGAVETHLTLGFDQSRSGDDGNTLQRSASLRSELRQELGRDVLLRGGVELTLDAYSTSAPRYFDPESPEVRAFLNDNPDRGDRTFGAWHDYVISAGGVEFTPGLRVDLYQSRNESAVGVEPRLAARFHVRDNVTLVHTLGLAHQPPSFVVPLPGRTPASLGGGLQRAVQASSGAELELGGGTELTGTLFYNIFSNMTDALATNSEGPPGASGDQRVNGYAYGAELMLRRSLSKQLGGFVSYTLSRSMRSAGNELYPSSFDRTHVANAAVAYDLGRKWRAGARLVFYTGTPDVPEPNGTIPALRSKSPPRTDPFFRVDVRLEKRWDLSERVWLAFVAEVMNASLSKETFGGQKVGPITIPSLGLELGF